jgi:hypothetical protein
MDTPIQCKGFVTLIDILGFKDFVFKDGNLIELFNYYDSLLKNDSKCNVDYLVFSDTIILYTTKDNDESFREIAWKSSNLLFSLLKRNIPVRGCLSYGDILLYKNERGTILAGNCIIDAYQFEEKLNWVGIVISPLLLKKYNDFLTIIKKINDEDVSNFFPNFIVQYNKIPLYNDNKIETLFDGYVIFPSANSLSANDYDELLLILFWNKLTAPDQKSQKKYDNTIEFIRELILNKVSDFSSKIKKELN